MTRYGPPLVSLWLSWGLLGLVSCSPAEVVPWARATQIEGLDQVIGGEKALGRPGDYLLENDRVRAIILDGRASLGPNLFGGSLVDADLQWNDPAVDGGSGRDQFNEMFPTVSMNIPMALAPSEVEIASDGSDGGPAVVRVTGAAEPFLTLLDLLFALVSFPDVWMTTDYILTPGQSWVTIRTTATFDAEVDGSEGGLEVAYPADDLDVIGTGLENGLIFGDFWLGGGSLDIFAPGIGFDEDGAVFEALQRGENTFAQPFGLDFVAGVGDGVSYGLVPKAGRAWVPLFTASQTAVVAGTVEGNAEGPRFASTDKFTYERAFLIGHGDVGSLVDQMVAYRDIPHGRVQGQVLEQGTGHPMSGADVFVFAAGSATPFSQWRVDVRPDDLLEDGSFGGALPVGDWELMVHEEGRLDSPRLPITVTEGGEVTVRLEALRPGTLEVVVRDETGQHVPAKVTLFRVGPELGDSPSISELKAAVLPAARDTILGDGLLTGSAESVLFLERGAGLAELPPGRYVAVASRGLEYELDISNPFVLDAQRAHRLELQVLRAIDSMGWISADLHVHSAPSHDSGVTLPMRVRSMVCEGVEFFAATDHDHLTDFAPTIEEMGLESWVQSAVGVETTTVEVGHYLGFPLQRNWLGDAGGAMDWTGMAPFEIVDELKAQGQDAGFDPLVFVAHPRDGILGYFDQYGFDPFEGEPGEPVFRPGLLTASNDLIVTDNTTLTMDALELFTGKRLDLHRTPLQSEIDLLGAGGVAEDQATVDWFTRTMAEQDGLGSDVFRLTNDVEGQVDDWFTLLNLGYRFTAVGNSDSHGMTSTEAGCPRNFVMSETDDPGFIDGQAVADAVREHRVVASYGPFVQLWVDGAPIGSDVVAEGPVEIEIEVQAPSWMDVDHVELYENGTLVETWKVAPDTASNLRFSMMTTREPTEDAWYVAIVSGDEGLGPVFSPVELPYIPLEQAVTEALVGIPAVSSFISPAAPFPKLYPIYPYALTNPIWVDVEGDGWSAPGRPSWLNAPDAEWREKQTTRGQ